MNRLLILACCIGAISANPVQEVQRVKRPRIVFGQDIDIEDAPYQVSIMQVIQGIYGSHMCGGSILSKNLVLTAGHCADLELEKYAIRSGSTTWLEGGKLHKVVEIIRHEDYELDDFERVNHDIAIMRVEPGFDLDGETEKLTELPEKDDKVKPGQTAFVTGWGKTEKGKASKVLKGLNLRILNFNVCSNDYRHFGEMTKYNICAEHPTGYKDMCNGDSGGPLVVKGKQVGIVSWSGPGCAIPGRPGVYTDVAHYREWIDEQMEAIKESSTEASTEESSEVSKEASTEASTEASMEETTEESSEVSTEESTEA